MAPQTNSSAIATLRAITFRIASLSPAQLPQQIPAISASLPQCKALLSSSQASTIKDASEISVVVHKFKTQLSTLIVDRSIQGRWAAVVLIKSTIEVGGWEVLQKSSLWVRGLLAILTKPDPPTSKRLSIITLTRIFLLTRDYPTLIREITTPSLPAFIQACLQIAATNVPQSLLATILESFNQLLPRYATVFRTYQSQIQPLIAPLIVPTPSNEAAKELLPSRRGHVFSEVSQAAQQLWVHLHNCAPKSTSAEEWQKSITGIVENAHKVANKVFRAVIEDWQSTYGAAQMANGHTLENDVKDMELNSVGIPVWRGLYAGSERLVSFLQLLKEYATTPTASTVYINLGPVMDLLTRIFSLTVPFPQGSKDWQQNVKLNNQVGREERESLWAVLPHIHVAAIEVLHALLARFGKALVSIVTGIIDQLVWVYNAERENLEIRTALYIVLTQILELSGPTLPKPSVESLKGVINACCNDLLPQDATVAQAHAKVAAGPTKGNGNQQGLSNADTFLQSSKTPQTPVAVFTGLQTAASNFLYVLLLGLPQNHVPVSLRAKLDRTAILTQHREAMIASVLNPPPSKNSAKPAASIMPILARGYANTVEVESLIRPRMPVIRNGKDVSSDDEEDEDKDEDEDEDMEDNGEDNRAEDEAEKKDVTMADDLRDHSNLQATDTNTAPPVTSPIKRSHPEISPPSPKRPRLLSPTQPNEPIKEAVYDFSRAPPIRAAGATEAFSMEQATAPVPAVMHNMAPPQATTVGSGDSDSDDEFGTLVLGPDTEDEDEVE